MQFTEAIDEYDEWHEARCQPYSTQSYKPRNKKCTEKKI